MTQNILESWSTEPANFLERSLYMTPQTVYCKTKWRTKLIVVRQGLITSFFYKIISDSHPRK